MSSGITTDSVMELGLQVGSEVITVVKATEVGGCLVTRQKILVTGLCNQLITFIIKGE